MNTADVGIVFVYLSLTFVVGIVSGMRETGSSFWVASRRASTLLLVISIIATQVGAGVIVGLASATYSSGIGLTVVSIISLVVGMFGMGMLAPGLKRFGDRFGAVTLPEFFRVRYGRASQVAASLVVLFTYMSFLAAQFLALAALLNVWSGLAFHAALVFACAGVVVYTAFAGLRGDLITDFLHFWVMVVVFFAILVPILGRDVPGAVAVYPHDMWSPAAFAGWSFLAVGIVLGGVLPMVSMEIWQRAYAATSPRTARLVFWVAPALILPFYIFATYLGMCARAAHPGLPSPDLAPFQVLNSFLPMGLLGLTVAALLATFLSTANSMALVVSATVYRDMLNRTDRRNDSAKAGRLWTFAAGVAGLALAFAVPSIVQVTLNAFYVLGVLFFPVVGGLFWRRATARGATVSIALGGIATVISLPFIPKLAFLPGLLASLPAFIVVSVLTSHSKSERASLLQELFEGPGEGV